MVYHILVFVFRKPGTTPTEFKTHYETTHAPLVKSLVGPLFPEKYTRRYIHRTETSNGTSTSTDENTKYSATMLHGKQTDVEYDAITEAIFRDEAAFQAFVGNVSAGENAEAIAADEEKFMDRERTYVVLIGDCVEGVGSLGG